VCQGAIRLLGNPKEQLPVRFAAVKAVANLCSLLEQSALLATVLPALDCCCVMCGAASLETLPAALETLETLLEAHARVAAERAPLLAATLLQAWQRSAGDQFVAELVLDLVRALARVPDALPALGARFFPVVAQLLLQQQQDANLVATAADMLGALAGATPNCLAAAPQFSPLFGRLLQLAFTSDDAAIVQACTRSLLAFVISKSDSSLLVVLVK
jgi:hypothetical protein